MHFLPCNMERLAISVLIVSCCIYTASGQPAGYVNGKHSTDSIVNNYLRNCDFEKALQFANHCRKQALFDDKETTGWLLKTCEIYLAQGNINAGKEMLDEAGQIIQRLKVPGHLLQFQYALQKGRYFHFVSRNSESLQWLRRSEFHAKYLEKGYSGDITRLYDELGYVLFRLNKYPASIRYYQLAIETQPGYLPLDLNEVTCFKAKMANVCWLNHEKGRSELLFRSCIEYLDTIENPLHPSLLEVYLILNGYQLSFYDLFEITKDLLRNATIILDKSFPSDHFLAGILYTEKSADEYTRTDFENALQYSKRALQILSKYSFLDQYKWLNYQTMARAYFWLERDYQKTIVFSKQAIGSLQGTGLSPAYLYYMIGLSYSMLQNKSLAIENLNKVISLASDNKKYPDNYDCSNAYQELGSIFFLENKHEIGRSYLLKSLAFAKRISEKGYRINGINRELGNSYSITGDYRQALAYIQQSIIAGCNIFKDTSVYSNPSLEDIVLTHNLISCLTFKAYILYKKYETENNLLSHLTNALECQELAVKLIEKRVIDIDDENSGLIIADLIKTSLDNAVSYAVLLYLRTGDRQYVEKAWEYAEKSKMQVLSINTMKKNNLIYSGLPDSLIKKGENLNHEILEIENKITLDEKNGNTFGMKQEALEKLAFLYGRRDELSVRLEENYPAYKRLKYNFTVAGIEQIQQVLEKDQVIVEYQLLNTEIITFVITQNDLSIHYQLIDKRVSDNIAHLRTAVSSNPLQSDPDNIFQAFSESSYYLYTKLIEPIYDKIKSKRLIIIPHNQLTQLPFEVLINRKPASNSPPDYKTLSYLIREFPIAYAYSANLLIDLNQGRKFGSGAAIFLPDYNSYNGEKDGVRLSLLEGAAAEASVVKKLTWGKLYKGNMADESTFKARASRYRILHIASHSILDAKDPGLSCLVMTAPSDSNEDGNLYSYELSQMELDAQLVVLSGCNTGYGLLRNSEGLISIARSFFYTGVRSVVYTLWPIADQAGSYLISNFYQGLRHRQTLDIAMRKAKLSYLEMTDPVKAHPFYWAGYAIVGKTDPVPLARPYLWVEILSSLVILILLSFLLYRKVKT